MQLRILAIGLASALLGVALSAAAPEAKKPERKVEGRTVESTHDPKVRLEFSSPIAYVGADRWILYDIADCEIHVFVEADKNKKVKRLYWVQFEGYIPEVSYTHDYSDSQSRATIGGKEFYVDAWAARSDKKPERPGSDTEHVRNLIKANGYTLPAELMSQRLVYLMPGGRQELMIIYSEDLAPTGYTVADVSEHGKAHDKWPAIEQAVLKRGLAGMKLSF